MQDKGQNTISITQTFYNISLSSSAEDIKKSLDKIALNSQNQEELLKAAALTEKSIFINTFFEHYSSKMNWPEVSNRCYLDIFKHFVQKLNPENAKSFITILSNGRTIKWQETTNDFGCKDPNKIRPSDLLNIVSSVIATKDVTVMDNFFAKLGCKIPWKDQFNNVEYVLLLYNALSCYPTMKKGKEDQNFVGTLFNHLKGKINWNSGFVIIDVVNIFTSLPSQHASVHTSYSAFFDMICKQIDFSKIKESQYLFFLRTFTAKDTSSEVEGKNNKQSNKPLFDRLPFGVFCALLEEKAKSIGGDSPKLSKKFCIDALKILAGYYYAALYTEDFMKRIAQYMPLEEFTRQDRIEILKALSNNCNNTSISNFKSYVSETIKLQNIELSAEELKDIVTNIDADAQCSPMIQFFLDIKSHYCIKTSEFSTKDWVNILSAIKNNQHANSGFCSAFKTNIPWYDIKEDDKEELGALPQKICKHYDLLRLYSWRGGAAACTFACVSFIVNAIVGYSSFAFVIAPAVIALVCGVYSWHKNIESKSNLPESFFSIHRL